MQRKTRAGRGQGKTLTGRVAAWSIEHRWTTIGAWVALVAIGVLCGAVAPGADARAVDPGDSGRAQQVIAEQGVDPPRESVLVQPLTAHAPGFRDDPGARAAARDLVDRLRATPGVIDVRSPLDQPDRVSADGRSGLVGFALGGPQARYGAQAAASSEAVRRVAEANPGLRVVQTGDRSLTSTVDQAIKDDMLRSEAVSLPITLVVLLVVFGSLVAATIPLLLAGTTVAAAFGFLGLIGKAIPVNSATSVMILLIGTAVSVDYTLFYLRRVREERARGASARDALLISARTSGHAVVVSGLTVAVCLTGLLFTGMDVFRGLAVGVVLVVGLAVVGSVTVLPALLAVLGHRVDRGRVPWLGRGRTTARESRFWSAVATGVVRRPVVWGTAGALGLVVLALPALDMRLQDPATTDSLPRSVAQVDAALRVQEAFPGSAAPARIAIWVDGGTADTAAVRAGVDRLRELAGADERLGGPVSLAEVGNVLVARVPLAGRGTDPESMAALEHLRAHVLPEAFGDVDGVRTAVSGKPTAQAHDFAEQLTSSAPAVLLFVVVLALALLALAFRSAVIPIVSVLLNLLSVGSAYGVVTWVFQQGHGEGLLGFTSYGGVVGWLPLFMFVVLFGLSMDYHIFILSRVRERLLSGASARSAIVGGIGASSGVVTSAAVIMTAVFAVFVTLSAIEYKMLGLGMAVAVLLDATLVRGVLLPAALSGLVRVGAHVGGPAAQSVHRRSA
ncbi:MMPL family transporter [Actinokineospora sp. G85]|uniref:MMPL family transporter n=1 Tax=Actinokineospora sp. G85 TaxID=3406626 RepID=UPI003C74B349